MSDQDPIPPHILADALQDRVHSESGKFRPAESIKAALPQVESSPLGEAMGIMTGLAKDLVDEFTAQIDTLKAENERLRAELFRCAGEAGKAMADRDYEHQRAEQAEAALAFLREQLPRIMELARRAATEGHEKAIRQSQDYLGHVDDMAEETASSLGFDTCPQEDCKLIRDALLSPTPAQDQG